MMQWEQDREEDKWCREEDRRNREEDMRHQREKDSNMNCMIMALIAAVAPSTASTLTEIMKPPVSEDEKESKNQLTK